MKKIFIALTSLAVLLTACSKDFISPRHNSSEPLDEYFNTPERLFQCLVAAYDPLEWYDYAFGQYDNLHLIFDVMGDDVYAGGSNEGDQPLIENLFLNPKTAKLILHLLNNFKKS